MTISNFQQKVDDWVVAAFGKQVGSNAKERALRLVEEAIEFAQSVKVEPEQLHKLIDYVYSRPMGHPTQEIAGTLVTLMAAASSMGVDVEQAGRSELRRISSRKMIVQVQRRQLEKRRALMTDD